MGRCGFILAVLALAGIGLAIWLQRIRARPQDFDVRTAPGVTVKAVDAAAALSGKKIDEFDVSPDGGVIVRIGGELHDAASGDRISAPTDEIESFALARGGLVFATASGRLWTGSGESRTELGESPFAHPRLRAREDQERLLIYGGDSQHGLYSFEADRAPRLLSGSPEAILAAASDEHGVRFSVGASIFHLKKAGDPLHLLTLPGRSDRIIGLAIPGDGSLYFSTESAVYALRGSLAAPLVLGIGGPLRMSPHGLMVLDCTRHVLYVIGTSD